jgi:3',5'-cyclic AMP phosphodiesterase CpdA
MSDPIRSSILVLSDLHFGADFLLEAEIDPIQMPWWLKHTAPKVRRFFETRCKSHDMAIVMHLPRYLRKVLRQLEKQEIPDQLFNLVILLGDSATYANGGSYSFLRQYLTQDNYADNSGTKRPGLKRIHMGDFIAIPGNHDKLLRKNLDLYHRSFCPYPNPQGSFFATRTINKQEFLFVLVEASKYATEDRKLDFSALSHLAAGEVSKSLRAEIKGKFEKLKKGETADEAALKDYDGTRKILLVHYAVDDRVVLGPAPHAQELIVSHRCEGLDELIRELGNSVDLVLHGHLHRPKIYNHAGVPIISATTTTQKDGENGFFVIKFMASGDIVVDHHKWNGNGFMRDQRAEMSVRIARPPSRLAAGR